MGGGSRKPRPLLSLVRPQHLPSPTHPLHVVSPPPPHTPPSAARVGAETLPLQQKTEMVPGGSHQRPQGPPLVYVTRFASHRGGVWQLRGPRGLRHQGPGLGACSAVERAAVESGPPGRELPTGTQARVTAIPDSTSFQLRRSRAPGAPRGLEQAARAGGGTLLSGLMLWATVLPSCECGPQSVRLPYVSLPVSLPVSRHIHSSQ